ncbi:hypothetical protein CI109_103417 [Kwoniella shandongensis]|uniref:Uncharacterized protein n=1 Tax=Kwoniella shandongensis TaxID=1734106 RepID=A0A5M6C0S7_9TREE|nr:uncharacterized protein CI109_004498 [Kwoniella shandongensis]KAA5527205.1 hypothetical protein CI109_004498 [Kwoniella shandongensis]
MSEDPTDIFDTSLSTLFSIPPIAFDVSSSSSPYYTYTPPPSSDLSKPIELRLPSPPSNLFTTLQANHVWLSSIYLADLLATQVIDVSQTRVAELGAGAGLPGIVALVCGKAESVISSDWGVAEVIDVISDNFDRAVKSSDEVEGEKWKVIGHEWGTDPSSLLSALPRTGKDSERFDILLLADVLWATASHPALIESIGNLLKPGGVAHLTAGLHTGRGPVNRFLEGVRDKSWKIVVKGEVRWKNDGGWEEYTEGMKKDSGEEERGVVVRFEIWV